MDKISIEVAYGDAHRQKIYTLTLPQGSSARNAADAAPVLTDFPDAQVQNAPLGIFGKAVKDSHILQNGDRVEIYRPLIADPKEARRRRAAAQPKKAA